MKIMRAIRLFVVTTLLTALTMVGWCDGGIEYLKNMQEVRRGIYRQTSPSVVRVQLVHRSMPAFLLSKLNRRASECEINPWLRGEISNDEAALWQGWCQSFVEFADQKFLPSLQSENQAVDWEKSLAEVYQQWVELARVEIKDIEEVDSLNRFSERLSEHVTGLGEELKKSSVISPKPLVRDQSTGVVIREGYVVTTMNIAKRHGPEDWIRVWSDSEVAFSTGEIVGVDPHTNLAVIRLATRNSTLVPPIGVNLGVKPQVGDFVFSFYHPFNQGLSMQTGEITSLYNQLPFFQCAAFHGTSFPTSPGSLGGPIVDLDGNLVGINTIFMSQGNMSEITYALPIGEVLACVDQIITKGTVERGLLGVYLSEYHCPIGHHTRVSVQKVVPGSPAGQMGIQQGDVIDSINGTDVHCRMALISQLYQYPPNTEISLGIDRGGKQEMVQLKLAPQPSRP